MNFYKHHIGDYAKKTVHLSLLEHGAYLLMLHAYYGTEKPLPYGEALYRIAHAHSKAERAAVDSVVSQFWTPIETGLVNGRAFHEMESAVHLIETARQNGNRGGRPPITQRVIENEPSGFVNDNPVGFKKEPSGKAIQDPEFRKEREGISPEGDAPKKTKRKASRVPPEFTPDPQLALAELPDIDVDREIAKFRDWEFKTPRSDWPAVWRNWVASAKESGKYAKRQSEQIAWR